MTLYFKPGYCPHCLSIGYIGGDREKPCFYCDALDEDNDDQQVTSEGK